MRFCLLSTDLNERQIVLNDDNGVWKKHRFYVEKKVFSDIVWNLILSVAGVKKDSLLSCDKFRKIVCKSRLKISRRNQQVMTIPILHYLIRFQPLSTSRIKKFVGRRKLHALFQLWIMLHSIMQFINTNLFTSRQLIWVSLLTANYLRFSSF